MLQAPRLVASRVQPVRGSAGAAPFRLQLPRVETRGSAARFRTRGANAAAMGAHQSFERAEDDLGHLPKRRFAEVDRAWPDRRSIRVASRECLAPGERKPWESRT